MPALSEKDAGETRKGVTLDYETASPLARRAVNMNFIVAIVIIAIYIACFTCLGIAILGG